MSEKKQQTKDLTRLPSYILVRIAHCFSQAMQPKRKVFGLTTIATRVVVALGIFDQLTVNALCDYAIAEQPTMSRALDKLEADGIIQRAVKDDDNRMRVIQLTPEGAQLFEKIWPIMLDANEAMLEGIAEADRDVTLRTLVKILENLRANKI